MNIVIKMELRKQGYIAYSYADAVKQFAKIYNEQEFDISKEILSKSEDPSSEFLDYAKRIVGKICKGEYDI